MSPVPRRLYWTAVVSNVLALGTLLRGTVVPITWDEQLLAIAFTSISLLCWILYFGKFKK